MELEKYLDDFNKKTQKSIDHFVFEMSKISTGKANPQIVKKIKVMYYDNPTELDEIATIMVPEPQQLLIKPFDATSTKDIVKAILSANLGNFPMADEGNQIRITFPPMTSDRRKELVKSLSKFIEQAKVGVRNARQEIIKAIKSDAELSEDMQKNYVEKIELEVKKKIERISTLAKIKENDLNAF
ncbi:ribosome-recycling factor [Mycoplasmopsis synoviae]|uniref:ribosome-recycling factor n=1 Tax=Mycoplasmopsis synoviae TaxID=2109 RepID=UPI0034DB2E34